MGHVKIIQSGRNIEVFEYEKEISIKTRIRKKPKRPDIRDTKLRYIRIDNARRRVKSFRRIVLSNLGRDEPPALLTLTMHEIVSVRRAYAAFKQFIERLRDDKGTGFKYIAVPEFQERGAVHFHALVWGLNKEAYEECPRVEEKETENDIELDEVKRGTRYFQSLWQRGTVDCVLSDGNDRLVGYLAKYMSKSMSDERLCGERAYLVSSNIVRSVQLPLKTAFNFAKEIWGLDLSTDEPLQKHEFRTQWLGKGTYRLFKI